MTYRISFPQQNITVDAEEGTTLLAAEIAAGLQPDAPCGGAGLCGKCRAEILSESGARESVLACRTKISRDITVLTAFDEAHSILSEAGNASYELSPAVKAVQLRLERPSLPNPLSDWERLKAAVRSAAGVEIRPDPELAGNLRKTLEETDYAPQAILCGDELLSLRKGGRLLTAAADIGTTTLVLYLADAESGQLLCTCSTLNPQIQYGADVISRANYAMEHSVKELSEAVRTSINQLLAEALEKAAAVKEDLYSLTLVGNTCMHHLFLGIDPSSLVLAPYVPVISDPLVLDAHTYGLLMNARAKLFLLPCIAGFVGADTAAVMLACDFDKREELTLAIDIGTNGELALGSRSRTAVCSTAAGPAFEGAKITFGMRGAAGAIDHASISDGRLSYSVIGGGKPLGICGSGLLDLTAALLHAGILDETGRFADPEELPEASLPLADRLRTIDRMRCFVIAEESGSGTGSCIFLSQKDIREIQLAKGALAAGIALLLKHLDYDVTDIRKVLLAGAFGSYLSPESACAIGLIPASLLSKIEAVGNAAGDGALRCALSASCLKRVSDMAAHTEFIELAADPDFQDRFVDELGFPEITASGQSVEDI